ncbi:MAG: chemotaxis protein CheW [Chloroflexi bacterium]|nr:MAG: chemotaxis protein CheW [Chloroflexota bacterium]
MTTATIVDAAERQLVVFDLAGESYGVNIGTVREIIRMQAVTHVPETPEFVEGVINLRGRVIPVVDLRKRFGLAVTEQTAESRIVVVDITGHDIGVIVDAVTEVLRVPGSAIESDSALVTTEDSYYMDGIAKIGARLLILLDLDRVLQLGDDTANRIAEVAA